MSAAAAATTVAAATDDFDVPKAFLKCMQPQPFSGRNRDKRTDTWLDTFESYCDATGVPTTGNSRIVCASLLLTDVARKWYKQLGPIEAAVIQGKSMTPYEVFRFKFRQRFCNANESDDAYDKLRALTQKRSVHEYASQFENYRNNIDDMTEREAFRLFRGGLKPEIRV
ncbi:hypothetical protein BGZ94_006585, partial [Podila epigama]